MFHQLSNVPAGTANLLTFVMLGLITISLLAGPALVYYYWTRRRKMSTEPASPAQHQA